MALRSVKVALTSLGRNKEQLMELGGLAAVASGAGLIWLPLGLFVVGGGLMLLAWGSKST